MFKIFFYIVNKKNIRDSQKRSNKSPLPSWGLGTRRQNRFPVTKLVLGNEAAKSFYGVRITGKLLDKLCNFPKIPFFRRRIFRK